MTRAKDPGARLALSEARWYGAYLWLRRPRAALARSREFAFYRQLLSPPLSLVFDIGASYGSKASIFRRFAQRVVGVEADPAAFALLSRRFAQHPEVVPWQAAVSDHTGTGRFFRLDDSSDAYNSTDESWVAAMAAARGKAAPAAIDVPYITIDDLIARFGTPEYIKLDIEGAELAALRGLSQPVGLLSFECNLPTYDAQLQDAIALLVQRSADARFNCVIDEPPRGFDLPTWVSGPELLAHIRERRYGYAEVYCRSTPHTVSEAIRFA